MRFPLMYVGLSEFTTRCMCSLQIHVRVDAKHYDVLAADSDPSDDVTQPQPIKRK